jgi:tetratricopeptide (TPR) repeat protein
MFGWLKKSLGRSTPAQSSGLAPSAANFGASRGDGPACKAEGDAFLQAGNLAEAIRSYRRALELDADQPGVRTPLAYALRDQGRLDEATVELETVVARDKRALDAHYLLGLIARDRGNTIAAIARFERVLELDPGAVEVYRDLALLLVSGRSREGRRAQFSRKGIALHPRRRPARLVRQPAASRATSSKRPSVIRPCAGASSRVSEAHHNRGIALQGLDRLVDALHSHDAALRAAGVPRGAAPLAASCCDLLQRPADAREL